jgi:glycosyltransferase involved in cell wall biosynthesis
MTTDGISVVIPAYNAARFLAEAVASVRAQTLPATEIIVVDDGSTDGTGPLAEQLGVKVLAQKQAGAGAARNRGAEASTGDWLAFLDADDLWVPEKLAAQRAAMRDQPGTELVFGYGSNFWIDDRGARREDEFRPAFLPGAAFLRREFFLSRARFNTSVAPSEVVEWYLRLRAENAVILVLPQLVLLRRLHESNTRQQGDGGRALDLRLVREWIERQRAGKP